jgi:hypothetical protein
VLERPPAWPAGPVPGPVQRLTASLRVVRGTGSSYCEAWGEGWSSYSQAPVATGVAAARPVTAASST